MSKTFSIGSIRNLSKLYAEIRKNLAKENRSFSLNDSGSMINDNGKMK
jgi:hypothetical protein